MSSSDKEIAPQGDLFILIGEGEEQKLVRVSNVILSITSPVFATLLGPQFREGNDANDMVSPLKLPGDHPSATINMFLIMHWKGASIDQSADDWLQKLIVACDKYQCIATFEDFFKCKMQDGTLANLDKLHIAAHMGDRERFAVISELLVRLPRAEVEKQLHADLLVLLPENCLDILESYRRDVRTQYNDFIRKIECLILKAGNGKFCYGLRERYLAFTGLLYEKGIKTSDVVADAELLDLSQIVEQNFRGIGEKNIDSAHRCTRNTASGTCKCSYSVSTAFKTAREALSANLGKKGECGLCFNCFVVGTCALEKGCGIHSPSAAKEGTEGGAVDANE